MTASSSPLSVCRVSIWTQCIAWIVGVIACLVGMGNLVAGWDTSVATIQFLWLMAAPVLWMVSVGRGNSSSNSQPAPRTAWILAISVGLLSWITSIIVGWSLVDLPPAYHDEYSYLFQARTLLTGVFAVPSHPLHPELFDQMHVLNEGVMASRYYPGTGLWLAPFVALRHPYWGQWLASSLAAMLVFWTGYELGRLRVALVSGLTAALSPGIALFSNLLLAHQPTLLGLSLFLWAFLRWQRTRCRWKLLWAGVGLSFAMLCRPATAAGFGFPFGIAFVYSLFQHQDAMGMLTWSRRWKSLIALGAPLVVGWSVMAVYHLQVTHSLFTSPYQLYTDIYTPRHVYGFDNVTRGEQKLGPKVIDAYDRWAENLTPQLAVLNTLDRWLNSWIWILDALPLLLSSVIYLGVCRRIDRRWHLIALSILSLHAFHVPYWYTGIMGWHYVFESCLGWCLLLGLATDVLFTEWTISRRGLMLAWWMLLLCLSLFADYNSLGPLIGGDPTPSRVAQGIASIRFPRRQYAQFDQWLEQQQLDTPALVLIEVDPTDRHMDYVVNSPGLGDPVIRGRYLAGKTNLDAIVRDFPERHVYLCQPKRPSLRRID